MTDAAHKPATYADLEAVPPHLVAEILFGNLVTHPRPVPPHIGASSVLGMATGNAYQLGIGGPGGWFFADEPELHLGPHVCVPDIAGWRKERLHLPIKTAYFEMAPDWVCEVISPSTERYDRGDKRRIYATYRVEYLWLVDPRAKILEIFVRRELDWLLTHTYSDNETVQAPPFDELAFALGLLWPFDPPADPAT
jgi:Uma2 family endonuclease